MSALNPRSPDLIKKVLIRCCWLLNDKTEHIVHRRLSYFALLISFSFIFLISCMCNKSQRIWRTLIKRIKSSVAVGDTAVRKTAELMFLLIDSTNI